MSGVRRLAGFNIEIKADSLTANYPELAGAETKIEELRRLIRPVIYWMDVPVEFEGSRLILAGDDRVEFASAYLAEGIGGSLSVMLMAATIGGRLPEYSAGCMEKQRLWEGTVADILGSHAIEAAAEYFFRHREREYYTKGLYPTLRYSPGYGDWSLKDQERIISILHTEPDIIINSNQMLEPVKSLTAMVGWSDKPSKDSYPVGNRSKGLCSGENTCSGCRTWACIK